MYMYIQVQLISSVFKQYLATCTTKRYLQSRIDDLHVNSITLNLSHQDIFSEHATNGFPLKK